MCDICLQHPCAHGCPNETEKAISRCAICGGIIAEDELYYFNTETREDYCSYCITPMMNEYEEE